MNSNVLYNGNYRYERKFLINRISKCELEKLIKIHPAMFSEIYHGRFVNNIYLDSSDFKCYYDAVDGVKNRLKLRIRWYGDIFCGVEKCNLELKIKNGLLGRKKFFPINKFKMRSICEVDNIKKILKESNIPEVLKVKIILLNPVLLNRYYRTYYKSFDHNYRVTIDSKMEYYEINLRNNLFLNKSIDNVNTIMELKYNHDKNESAENITKYFPFRMTKSSKYSNGIDRIFFN